MASPLQVAFDALPKAAFYVAVALAVGTVTARWLLVCRETERPSGASVALLAGMARSASVVAVVALAARLVGHTAAVFGPAEALA
ncbi:MAG TPA: hypothetical protein VMW48_17540, partial [Vicinamibacterales bacterium]|nr:hypothetical protein [Vicinamibacterales bacterium]